MTGGQDAGAAIRLGIDEAGLKSFCDKLIARSRDIARTHDALVTLETFIALFGRDQAGTPDYQAIEALMKSCTERTRLQLLAQRSRELAAVLIRQDVAALTALHTPLSREGFHQAIQAALAALSEEQQQAAAVWARDWAQQATRRAQRASAYPDALDFAAAGIDVETWQAMNDLSRSLGG